MLTTSLSNMKPSPLPPVAPAERPAGEAPVNLLLVDDDDRNLDVLESILDCPDYRLIRARTAQDALLALMAGE